MEVSRVKYLLDPNYTKNDTTESDRKFYSDREKILLMSLVEKFKHILENKKTDGTNLRKKNAAWKKICEMYNVNDVFHRTEKQLKKLWDNLKQRTRKIDSDNKKACIETGGGPPLPEDKDPLNEMVRAIVPTIGFEIDNPWDSTSLIISERKQQISTCDNKAKEAFDDIAVIEVDAEPEGASPRYEESSASLRQCKENTDVANECVYENGNISAFVEKKRLSFRECSTPRSNRRKIKVDEEANLRVKKLKRSIEQQEEFHTVKMEACRAEISYWLKRAELLNCNKDNN